MSIVTTILITTSIMEGEEVDGVDSWAAIDHVNACLGGGPWFKCVNDYAGGNKCPQADAFMAAINHLNLNTLRDALRSAPWVEPESVLVLVNLEEDDGFSVLDWRS